MSSTERGRNISRTLRRNHARREVEMPRLRQGEKRCARCGVMKRYDVDDPKSGEYTIKRHRLKSGGFAYYPQGACRACENQRIARAKARMVAEDEESFRQRARASSKRHYNRGGKEARDRRRREERRRSRRRIPIEPLITWLDEYLTVTGTNDVQFAARLGITPRRLHAMRHTQKSVTLKMADMCFIAAGMADQMVVLYGEILDA